MEEYDEPDSVDDFDLQVESHRFWTTESTLVLAQMDGDIVIDWARLGLRHLPLEFMGATNIISIDLDNNYLSSLPSLSHLSDLEDLSIANNQLTDLPESIGDLLSLRTLDLSGNRLTYLPESIRNLEKLESLNLANNQLKDLPSSLGCIETLRRLVLIGNDSLRIPAEIISRERPDEIIDYYSRLREGSRPLNQAKLIFVGRGGVGKTSLSNMLTRDVFNSNEQKTEGINITEWWLNLRGIERVQLNIWDFGGQEILHATHQFFLTARSLYVLVLNGREGTEEADADYWLKLVESFGGDSPLIIALNKINEHSFDVNRRALLQKYPFIVRDGFVKTDCEDGTGIAELRHVIERETNQLKDLRVGFPKSWFLLKEKLAAMNRNYLSFEDYRKLCVLYGESDSKSQDLLAGYLHDLGIVLNYRDDPRLYDTHVLNPHWVTGAIYRLLNAKKIQAQQGQIYLTDVPLILDENEVPRSMHRFVFDLMKKFELCFSYPDDDTHYLIPELLDKQQPAWVDELITRESLKFQYNYPVLPEGLLPRFIVRTHQLSETSPKWRRGVILEFEECVALVAADIHEKKVSVSISGPTSSRRRLLAIIRSDFERIHRDIRNLNPLEMVPLSDYPQVLIPYKKLQVMEQRGVETFTEVVDDQIIELNVQELLNGVDLEGTRKWQSDNVGDKQSLQVFISYSHKDERLRTELETHLKLMQRQGLISIWSDRRIEPGQFWQQEISKNLELANLILLLVSADFVASDYCFDIEMKRAIERHERGEAVVVPIILRPVNWHQTPFAHIQALPNAGRPITQWRNRDTAWQQVEQGLRESIVGLTKYNL